MVVVKGMQLSEDKRERINNHVNDLIFLFGLTNGVDAVVELSRGIIKVSLSTKINRHFIKGEGKSKNVDTALGNAYDMIEGRIRGYKEKMKENDSESIRHHNDESEAAFDEYVKGTSESVTKRKSFELTVMTEEEAIEQMLLLGHSFFIYLNEEGETSVIYKRDDGFGLIEAR